MQQFIPTRAAWSQLLLRIGIAVVFLYAAISAFIDPNEWIGFLPPLITENFKAETVLHIFSVIELVLAAWLLSGAYVRWAALFAAAMLSGIVVSNFSIFQISFRDIAIIFAALALAAMPEAEQPTS